MCVVKVNLYASGCFVSGEMGVGDNQSKELGRSSSCSGPSTRLEPDDLNTKIVGDGEGANAISLKAGIEFASMDTLSELVWSPRNGLSLKCTNLGFTGKGKLLSPFFDVGQINDVIPSNSRSIEGGFQVNLQLSTQDIMDRAEDEVNQECSRPSFEMNRPLSGIGDSVEDMSPGTPFHAQQITEREDMAEGKVKANADIESEEEAEAGIGSSRRTLDRPRAIGGESGRLLEDEQPRLESAGSEENPANGGEKEDMNKTNRVLYVDRLESMDENDLAALAVAASNTLASEGLHKGKGDCLADATDAKQTGPVRHPPANSGSYRRRMKAKGKEKASSDGDFDGRIGKVSEDDDDDDDESYGSVESCNSAGLLSRGKKRSGFEQQLILGSKRLKTLSQECLGSTSKFKQDSSFMNWISNMTKGLWKGNEEDSSPFVALTTSDTNGPANVITGQQLSPCCLKENSGCRNTGFQSFFESIYCPRKRSQDAEMDFPNEPCDRNAASLLELPCFPEQCLTTKGDHLSSSGNEIGLVAEPNISSKKDGSNKVSEEISSEIKHESCTNKEQNMSLVSLSKSKPDDVLKTPGEADGKVTQCLSNRKVGLESLWISRFSSRSSFPQKKGTHSKVKSEVAMEGSTDWKQRISSVEHKGEEANEIACDIVKTHDSQERVADNNVMPSVSTLNRFDDQKTVDSLSPIVSSLRKESSDAMASLFARRLEAIKHIMPSGLAETVEEEQVDHICFYCGKKGHLLRDCLEVTDTELRDLVQNISTRNGREVASSLCIRCFQLNHWAATCPDAPPYSLRVEDRLMKHALASTSGTKLPLSDFTNKQVTDVPKSVFDAVQVLRLTRTDILKWMNTKASVCGLEGFFLRLRLGKWEEGLGGTGYYVACIAGTTERQSSVRQTENSSILVKVGGMTCCVESPYISNQDFLEEEVKVWWRSAGRSAG